MALDEKEVARTLEATEKTLSMFAALEKTFHSMIEEKESLARGLGAESYAQVVAASQKGISEEARKKLDEAQATLAKELEEDAAAVELRFRQDQSSQRGSGSAKVRRMGRMV